MKDPGLFMRYKKFQVEVASKWWGAAEFCFILVVTMEMGIQALLVWVFHY
jgi:hypothetical protein